MTERVYVTKLPLEGDWNWILYDHVEAFLRDLLSPRRRGRVSLVDSQGQIGTRSVAEARRYAAAARASPVRLEVAITARRRVRATLTVTAEGSGAVADVRFSSRDEVQAKGLVAALEERLLASRELLDEDPIVSTTVESIKRQAGTFARIKRAVRNPWLVGISSSVIAGVILFLVLH
jgi:hypothetical protein